MAGAAGSLGDFCGDLSLYAGKILRVQHLALLNPCAKAQDRFLLTPSLDLSLVSIELRIEHRVGAQPIGAAFEEIGLSGFPDGAHGSSRGRLDGDHIHPIDGLCRHAIAGSLALDVRLRFRDRKGSSHGVKVVLADEQHW